MSYEELPCSEFVELATDSLEGSLQTEQRLVVERHLASCTPCIDYWTRSAP
ncbi:MAG: zf-HC2 domain-containing protein [Solirubrobacteraceae bacterium]